MLIACWKLPIDGAIWGNASYFFDIILLCWLSSYSCYGLFNIYTDCFEIDACFLLAKFEFAFDTFRFLDFMALPIAPIISIWLESSIPITAMLLGDSIDSLFFFFFFWGITYISEISLYIDCCLDSFSGYDAIISISSSSTDRFSRLSFLA